MAIEEKKGAHYVRRRKVREGSSEIVAGRRKKSTALPLRGGKRERSSLIIQDLEKKERLPTRKIRGNWFHGTNFQGEGPYLILRKKKYPLQRERKTPEMKTRDVTSSEGRDRNYFYLLIRRGRL